VASGTSGTRRPWSQEGRAAQKPTFAGKKTASSGQKPGERGSQSAGRDDVVVAAAVEATEEQVTERIGGEVSEEAPQN